MGEKLYEFVDIIKDGEGDFVGVIEFYYNECSHRHEFTFVIKERKLISIDYGFKIPYISSIWNEIEDYLKNHSRI